MDTVGKKEFVRFFRKSATIAEHADGDFTSVKLHTGGGEEIDGFVISTAEEEINHL